MFKSVTWANLDDESKDRFVTVDNFLQIADGKTTLTEIRAGFPIAKIQVDPQSNAESEQRLSVLISGTKKSYIVVPVSPDAVGNFVQPNDRVDVLVSLGENAETKDLYLGPDGELLKEDRSKGNNGTAGAQYEPLLASPLSKLILQNMRVIRVDREIPRDNNSSSTGQNDAEAQREKERQKKVADVKRLYIEVDRDQLEVLSFVLNNGKRNIAVRATTGDTVVEPTEGVAWNDFVRWFYIQRGKEIQADSFRKVGPYDAAPKE